MSEIRIEREHFEGVSKAGKEYSFDKILLVVDSPLGELCIEVKPADKTAEQLLGMVLPPAKKVRKE